MMNRAFVAVSLLTTVVGALQPSDPITKVAPWCTVPIDYSAANEFIKEHYGSLKGAGQESYFRQDTGVEDIYNAREGFICDSELREPTLRESGFCLKSIVNLDESLDFQNLQEVQQKYLPRLREMVEGLFPSNEIEQIIFYNPTNRRKGYTPTSREDKINTPKSDIAGMAHIDSDINAFGVPKFLDIVQKNTLGSFPEQVRDLIEDGNRFAIVNTWKNIADAPIRKAPLAFMPAKYAERDQAFPSGSFRPDDCHWYTFPEMTADEVLLFYQYDRDVRMPADVWHCALKNVGGDDAPDRESFDIRCLVVFKEAVDPDFDRLSAHRMTPLLDYDESAAFCTKQGEGRKKNQE